MKFNSLKELLDFRVKESEENYWIEDYRKTAITALSQNISETIAFIDKECNDEEFYWITELMEELVEKTQSKKLISVCRERLSRVDRNHFDQKSFQSNHMRHWVNYDVYVRDISTDLEYAEGKLTQE